MAVVLKSSLSDYDETAVIYMTRGEITVALGCIKLSSLESSSTSSTRVGAHVRPSVRVSMHVAACVRECVGRKCANVRACR